MPYLNWRSASLQQEVKTEGSREFKQELKLDSELLSELLPMLEEIFLHGGSELRVDLPNEWIVFWKLRDGESRLLMAHPQPNEWVSTVALEAVHGKRLIESLRSLSQGQSVSVEDLGSVGSISNVELVITRA